MESTSKVSSSLSYFFCLPCGKPFIDRITQLALQFFHWLSSFLSDSPEVRYDAGRLDYDEKNKEFVRKRDLAAWANINKHSVEGISGKSFELAAENPQQLPFILTDPQKSPLLTVSLPRRQISCFPQYMQDPLLKLAVHQLDIHFVIYEKPSDKILKLNFEPLFPEATDSWISVTTPSHNWAKKRPTDKAVIFLNKSLETFYLGAYFNNCYNPDQSKGVALFGVVVENASSLYTELQQRCTIQEFLDTLSNSPEANKIRQIFTFNINY